MISFHFNFYQCDDWSWFQINYIYNQLKLKLLGIPLRDFLYCIVCGKNSYPKSVPHSLAAAHFKRHEISKHFLLPYCPPSHWQLYLSCCWEMSSLILEPTYLRCKCRLKICNSLGIFQDSDTRWSPELYNYGTVGLSVRRPCEWITVYKPL